MPTRTHTLVGTHAHTHTCTHTHAHTHAQPIFYLTHACIRHGAHELLDLLLVLRLCILVLVLAAAPATQRLRHSLALVPASLAAIGFCPARCSNAMATAVLEQRRLHAPQAARARSAGSLELPPRLVRRLQQAGWRVSNGGDSSDRRRYVLCVYCVCVYCVRVVSLSWFTFTIPPKHTQRNATRLTRLP